MPNSMASGVFDGTPASLERSVRRYAIGDAEIDRNIDVGISGLDRSELKRAMKGIPQEYRSQVVLRRHDGTLIANHRALLELFQAVPHVVEAIATGSDGLGGENTGAFNRVSLTAQGATTLYTVLAAACSNGFLSAGKPAHALYILTGPVGDNGGSADIGYQYDPVKDVYLPFFTVAGSHGVNFAPAQPSPCGDTYSIYVGLEPHFNASNVVDGTLVLAAWYYAGSLGTTQPPLTLMYELPAGTANFLDYDGSDSRMRRAVAIAQNKFDEVDTSGNNFTSGEFFGFSPAIPSIASNLTAGSIGNPPNLGSPGIAFEETAYNAKNGAGDFTTGLLGNTVTEANPNDPTKVIVRPDQFSNGSDANDYEGIYLHQ